MKTAVANKKTSVKIVSILIASSLFLLHSCSSSGEGEKKNSKDGANGLGTSSTNSSILSSPTPSGSPNPTPSVLPGDISGLTTTTFPSFYIGVDAHSNNPDPAPYSNFSMCVRGQFGQRSADSHVVALADQTISIDLRKTAGCNYTFTLNAVASDSSKTQTVTRSMKNKQTQTVTVPVVKGSVLEATIRIDTGTGGCDAGETRVLYQTLTAVVPKTASDCSN